MTTTPTPLDLPAFLAGMGITPRYIALIELSRRRIDATGHELMLFAQSATTN